MENGASQGNSERNGRKRKSKGRMSYLKRFRNKRGEGDGKEAKTDEFGKKYGDYVPVPYGKKPEWRNRGGPKLRNYLKPGMIGFLCTTNFKEKECVREAYNLLNEFSEKSAEDIKSEEPEVGNEEPKTNPDEPEIPEASTSKQADDETKGAAGTQPETKGVKSDDEDIEDALANELKNLKSDRVIRKFQSADTGITNVVFISTTISSPEELVYRIFDDVTTKKQTKSRFLLRLLPIELTCYTNINDEFKSKVKEVIEKHMKTGYASFKIVANARLNGKVSKDEYVKTIADLVSQVNPLSFVDLNNPQFTIAVEILKTIVCIGIVKDFVKFKKYNLLEAGCDKPPLAPVQTSGKDNQSEESGKTNDEPQPEPDSSETVPVKDEKSSPEQSEVKLEET